MRSSGRVATGLSYALVVILVLLTTVWGAFLVPFRLGGTLIPVSLVIVAASNAALGLAGGRLLGRWGAAATGVLWMYVAFTLGSRRPEGDLIIANGWVGLGYLVVGVVSAAVAFGLTPLKRLRPPAVSGDPATPAQLAGADRTS